MSKTGSDEKKLKSADTGITSGRTASMESTASVSAGTTGRYTGGGKPGDSADGVISTYGHNLYDMVSVIVWCPKHKKVALSKISDNKGLFFPVVAVKTGQTWYDSLNPKLKEILKTSNEGNSRSKYLSHSPIKLVHILRLQIPIYCEFVSRIIFMTELTADSKSSANCCVDNKTISWFSGEDLVNRKVDKLWGPEPEVFIESLMNGNLEDLGTYSEFGLKDILLYSAKERPKVFQDEMVKMAGFGEKDIFKLFGDFIQQSFPSQYQNLYSFEDYMTKLGVPQLSNGNPLNIKGLYRAFCFSGRPFLSFHEFLLGLCALDKNTAHGGRVGEIRSSYIFRYYNENGDKKCMNFDDIKLLARDMIRLRSDGQFDETKVDTEAKQIMSSICGTDKQKQIDDKCFIKSVGERRLRGTAVLFRSVLSPVQQIRLKRVFDSLQLIQKSVTALDAKIQNIKGTCPKCKQKKYALAMHTVRLSKDGLIVDPQENKGQSDTHKKSKSLRRMSEKVFSSSSANFLLDVLRNYAYSGAVRGLNDSSNDRNNQSVNKSTADVWRDKNNRWAQVDKILSLCSQCEQIFKREPRLIRVTSPVYVLGDIHGNFHDLIIYERCLWKMGPTCISSCFLFLGDYVDRGEHSIECIVYLLSNKALAPEKFWLLRGNHELRPVQTTFTFKNECVEKFGSKVGLTLWEAFNKVFDVMPICAVIDDSIFCAHGGIPTTSLKLEELLKIPTPLEEPETQSAVAWQMLWNDPVTNQEFRDYQEMLKEQQPNALSTGFLPNTKRGTAYFFADQALNRFLSANQLSHVIRAHEVIPNGYAFHMGGKCITIFSSSKYCGGLNEAAVILCTDEKIRVIKVDTN